MDTVAKRSGSVLPGGGFNKWLSLSDFLKRGALKPPREDIRRANKAPHQKRYNKTSPIPEVPPLGNVLPRHGPRDVRLVLVVAYQDLLVDCEE